MANELEFRFGDFKSVEQQVNLFNATFNQNATVRSWIRKHGKNPLSNKCNVMCAFDGDKIVGINGFIPMEYKFNGQTIRAIQSCDTAVNPQYRGRGIFTKMIAKAQECFAREGYDVIVGYPNKNSYNGFIKLGWVEVNRTMKYFFPTNVSNVARDMMGKRVPGFFNPLADLWRLVHFMPYILLRRSIIIEKASFISAEKYDEFLRKEGISANVSQEYLDWKLSSAHCIYKAFYKEKLVCQIVTCDYYVDERYRRCNILGVTHGECEEDVFTAGFCEVINDLHKKYDILSIWENHDSRVNSAYKKLGFIKNFSESQGSPLIVKVLTDDKELRNILLNPDNWCPNFIEADYVLDHNI